MILPFYKYQGTGNDFILIDNRSGLFNAYDTEFVAHLCNRRMGIGADGLMLLQNKTGYDFEMVYYNADGHQSSMCGNGGRCITAFAQHLGIVENGEARFIATDGPHEAFLGQKNGQVIVKLKMQDVDQLEIADNYVFLNTGSPHYVVFTENVKTLDVYADGRKVRYNSRFAKEGTNVNFVERMPDALFVRTYERGVEAETLSCGTGVTASAIAASALGFLENRNTCPINTLGGNLTVSFNKEGQKYNDIWLEGPATLVYEGKINV